MSDFEIVWNSSFFGITVGEMALASLVLFAFILTRKFFARVVIERLKRWASLTKTDIDDQIVVVLQQPLMFLFFIIGLFIVVNWIAFSSDTEAILNQIIKSIIL